MRLKLNRTLRAALIAAITAVGATLPQAQAWGGGPEDNHGGKGWVYYMDHNANAPLTCTNENTFWLTSNSDSTTEAAKGEVTLITAKDGALIHISGGNQWGDNRLIDVLIDDIAVNGGAGAVSISTAPWTSGKPAEKTKVNIKAVSTTLSGVDNYGIMTLGSEGSTINASGLINSNSGATLTLNGTYVFDTTNASNYTIKTQGQSSWTDGNQGFQITSGSTFYAIKDATKGAGFSVSTSAAGPSVEEDEAGNYCFTAGDVLDTTKFYVKAATATLDRNGTGQIIVEKEGATVTVQNATYRDTSGPKNLNIVVGDGGVYETTYSGQNGFISGTLEIQGGGIFRVAGQHDAFGWGTVPKAVVLQGEQGKEARLEFNQTTGNSATFACPLTMKGYANITSTKEGGSAGFNTYPGSSITVENKENYIEVLDTRREGVTITVKDGGELTVKKQTINGSDHSNKTVVVKQGAGTLLYTGDTKAEGLDIQAGTVVFSNTAVLNALTIGKNGTVKVTGGTTTVVGNSNVISNTIELTGGELKLGGTYDISGLDLQGGGTNYVGGTGIADGNGFAQTSGTLNVVHVDGGTLTLREGVVFNYNASPVTVENGVVTLPGTTNYSTLYVNNADGVSFNAAWGIAREHETDITTVMMAADTNIDMDKDGASVALTLKGSTTLKAAADTATTISSISGWQDSILTVAGTGAIALPGGERTLTGSTKLDVQGNASTGKLVLDSNDAALTVAEGATLTMSGNLTPTHGSVNINGTVKVNGELDLSNGKKSDVRLVIGTHGAVTANGMWMHRGGSLQLLEGGSYSQDAITITGKGESSTLTFSGEAGTDDTYGTKKANFVITDSIVTAAKGNIELGNTLVNSGVATSAHQVTLNNAASTYAGVTVSGTGSLVIAADSNISGTSSLATGVTINDASTLTNSGTMSIDGTIVFGRNAIQNTGTITLGDSIHFNLTGMTAVDNKYTLFSGNAVDLSMYDASRITISGSKDAYNWTFGQDGTITFALNAYTWNGGETGVWDYETPNWNDPAVPFAPGYAAQFDSSATVAVTGAIEASEVIVRAGNEVTLTEGADGYLSAAALTVEGTLNTAVTVLAESYTIAQGGTWNIQGEQALVDGTNEGTIHVDTTGDVMVWSDTPETALAGVKNDGKVGVALANDGSVLNMGESNGTLEVYSGAISYLSHLDNQTVELDGGSKLLFGDNAGTKDDAVFANDIVMNGDATVQVWGSSKHSSATISGDVSGAGHTLTKTDGDQSLIFSGVVTLGGLTTANDGKGTIVFSGGAGSVGYIKTLNAVTIQFSAKTGADNVYSFESFNMSSDDNQTNATRWLVVDSGVTLNGTGTSRKYGSTIENSWGINGGGLEINGTLNTAGIIAMDAGATTAYIKGSGLINTKGLDLCNNTKTYIQDGITINITSDTGIYKRNNNAEVHLLNATLQATEVDWAIKDGGAGYKVTLDDAETGTTFDVAADRTITIANILGGEGKLVKTGEGTLVLSNDDTHTGGIDVQEGKLVVKGTIASDITMGANASIENQGASPITLSNVDEQLKHIENTGAGEMVFMNESGLLSVVELTIGADSTVSFYDQAEIPAEGTITVTETLTAGGGTLLANLEMADGSTLDLSLMEGGIQALTLGSEFTIADGALVKLDDETLAAIAGLENIGDKVVLLRAYTDGEGMRELTSNLTTGDWARTHFDLSSITDADYKLYVTGTEIGLVKSSNAPEPTTGTLSLLALMALAARRRRK